MGKMLPCKACLPRGGKARHEMSVKDIWATPTVHGWRCDNCGHFKEPRGPQRRTSYDFVTKDAASDRGLSIANGLLFHAFNAAGLYAELKAVQEEVAAVVERTGCPNGVVFVHGSLNGFPRKTLFEAVEKRSRVDRITYRVTIETVERAIRDARAWIAEKAEVVSC